MPIQSYPKFKSVPDRMLEIPQPAIGGLNLKDLEFEQEVNQSPYMLNMMYRNGSFAKRYGQAVHSTYSDKAYDAYYFNGNIFVHAGTNIYRYNSEGEHVSVASGLPQSRGLFIVYSQKLYYLASSNFYEYNGTTFTAITPTIPEFMINCYPDGTQAGDIVDELNILGNKANWVFNSDGTSTVYQLSNYDSTNLINWDVNPTITVDDVAVSFTVQKANKTITFSTAPVRGEMNVVMTFTLKSSHDEQRAEILSCKYYETYGGSQNSRLFLAGCGNSKYYYSGSYDIAYWPEGGWAKIGNTEEDITGFGKQYNILIIFKPKEIYSIVSYESTSSEGETEERFKSQVVNARIGCDAPYSIQLINNLLTWFNSNEGICTLVSTNIQDERNVRLLSRNIDRTNHFDVMGILDQTDPAVDVQSVDFDNKYFLAFPSTGNCYVWDYEISPYHYSASGETPTKSLSFFLFDHFKVQQFLKANKELMFLTADTSFETSIIKLDDSFKDVDYNGDGEDDAIQSYYMTPFLQFNAVEYLKNIKNIYVQCRGDTSSVIDMYYYTEENVTPEEEPESIRIGGKLWVHFHWENFQWLMVNWANTFRRKCNLKKVQMASFFFENNEPNRDLSITHIGLQYQLVKYIR